MSDLWPTSLRQWTSLAVNDKKFGKIEDVLKKLTRRGTTNDIQIKMSKIKNDSLSSLYLLNSSVDNSTMNPPIITTNNVGISLDETDCPVCETPHLSANLNNSTKNVCSLRNDINVQIRDCDDYKANEVHHNSMNREDIHREFGSKNTSLIIDEFLNNDASKKVKLIKVKIIVPKGSLNKNECAEDRIFEQNFFRNTEESSRTTLDKFSYIISEKIASLNESSINGMEFPDFEVTSIGRTVEKIDAGSSRCSSPSSLETPETLESVSSDFLETRDKFGSLSSLENFTPMHKSSQFFINHDEILNKNTKRRNSDNIAPIKVPDNDDKNRISNKKQEPRDLNLLHRDLKKLETCIEEKVENVKKSFHDILKENEKKRNRNTFLKFNSTQQPTIIEKDDDIELPFPEIEEDDLKRLVNRSLNYPPIMGKNALLAKANALRSQNSNVNRDPEIIKSLVIERFNAFLMNHYKRSFQRSLSKRSSGVCSDDGQNERTGEASIHGNLETSNTFGCNEDSSDEIIDNYKPAHSSESKSDEVQSTGGSTPSTKSSINSLKSCDLSMKSYRKSDSLLAQDETRSSEKLEYDERKFLHEALGDEVNTTLSTSGRTDNTLNATLDSTQHVTRTPSEDHSIGTSELSALLSKASSLYSTISKRMRRSTNTLRKPIRVNEEMLNKMNEYEECFESNERLADLMRDSAVQHQIILQTSKALNYCNITKEFTASCEQIEAERILLIATCKREAILDEIKKIEYEDISDTELKNLGSISLSYLRFPVKQNSSQPNDYYRRNKEFSHWFVCLVNCGSKLFASNATLADCDGNVNFDNEFHFFNLLPDFEIDIAIYSMKVRNNARNYSHESKYRLNKGTKTKCPKPQKMLHLHKETKTKNAEASPRPSSFTLWGITTIRIGDLPKNNSFKLKNVPRCSTLDGTLLMNVNSSVNLNDTFAGFLNIGSESGDCITWNRRWCSLCGSELKYWNYPLQEGDYDPLKTLDLSFCVNSWISLADRSICARPKTLLLETVVLPNGVDMKASVGQNFKYSIVRHFLAADSLEEMKNWEKRLNSVVSSLRNWNSMKCQLLFKKDAGISS